MVYCQQNATNLFLLYHLSFKLAIAKSGLKTPIESFIAYPLRNTGVMLFMLRTHLSF